MLARDADKAVIDSAIRRLVTGAGTVKSYYNDRVPVDIGRRELYSYGTHFPLCRYVPRRYRATIAGEWQTVDRRRPPLFVINGDTWRGNRSRTWQHQTDVRAAIAASGVQSIILPFSALNGAGIDIDSIAVLDVESDAVWEETIERRTLAELPRWRRTYADTVPRESRVLHAIPANMRETYRELTESEIASGAYPYAFGTPPRARLPVLPDADGVYRWNEPVQRPVLPDEDGVYRYTESQHRLGSALFTAERDIVEPRRPAAPFESDIDTRRLTVQLRGDTSGRAYCEGAGTSGRHESGAGGSCIYCGEPLTASVTYRRRARYISSFDYNESPPLYFLCECSRNGAPTVAGAIDSLAPRAVHAAILAGREVRRQGDIFFIDTPLTTATLADRGATFGRFTLWSRGAKPRAGEITYRAPDRARDKAMAARELKYARRLWRDEWRAMQGRAYTAYLPDAAARERSRAQWRELSARHAGERLAATAAGVDYEAPESAPCTACGAGVGVACLPLPSGADIPYRLRGAPCNGATTGRRMAIAAAHAEQRRTLARECAREVSRPPAPYSGKGSRARWNTLRREHAADVETARRALRAATLAVPVRRSRNGGRYWNETTAEYHRRVYLTRVRDARARLDSLLAAGVHDSRGNTSRRHARDVYRARYGTNATALWSRAVHAARLKYRPETIADADRWRRNRDAVRAHLSIYGTAHTATDVARIGTAVYVRGTVRHAVDLESGRAGGPDHMPITLTTDRWYLAVRNTVPRQNRRRRRRSAPAASGNIDRGNE